MVNYECSKCGKIYREEEQAGMMLHRKEHPIGVWVRIWE